MTTLTFSVPQEIKERVVREENYSSLISKLLQDYYDNQSPEALKLKKLMLERDFKEQMKLLDTRIQMVEASFQKNEKLEKEAKEIKVRKTSEKFESVRGNLKDLVGHDVEDATVSDYLEKLDNEEVANIWEYADELKKKEVSYGRAEKK